MRLVGEHGSGVFDFLVAHQRFQIHGATGGESALELWWIFGFVVECDEKVGIVNAGFDWACLGIDRRCEGQFKPQGEQIVFHGLTIDRHRGLRDFSVGLFGYGEVFRLQQVLDVFVGERLDFLGLIGAIAVGVQAFERELGIGCIKIPADAQTLDLAVWRQHDRCLHGGVEMRVGHGGAAG